MSRGNFSSKYNTNDLVRFVRPSAEILAVAFGPGKDQVVRPYYTVRLVGHDGSSQIMQGVPETEIEFLDEIAMRRRETAKALGAKPSPLALAALDGVAVDGASVPADPSMFGFADNAEMEAHVEAAREELRDGEFAPPVVESAGEAVAKAHHEAVAGAEVQRAADELAAAVDELDANRRVEVDMDLRGDASRDINVTPGVPDC
jgi:hypothetical protein